jgi:hypothetical protein
MLNLKGENLVVNNLTDDEIIQHAIQKIKRIEAKKSTLFVRVSYTTKIDEASGSYGFTSKPADEILTAAAVEVRHFLAERSPLNMGKIKRILDGRLSLKKREDLESYYDTWLNLVGLRKTRNVLPMNLILEGEEVTQLKLIDLWLNGDIFHTDTEKFRTLQKIRDNPFSGLLEMNFIITLIDLAAMLIVLRHQYLDQIATP